MSTCSKEETKTFFERKSLINHQKKEDEKRLQQKLEANNKLTQKLINGIISYWTACEKAKNRKEIGIGTVIGSSFQNICKSVEDLEEFDEQAKQRIKNVAISQRQLKKIQKEIFHDDNNEGKCE